MIVCYSCITCYLVERTLISRAEVFFKLFYASLAEGMTAFGQDNGATILTFFTRKWLAANGTQKLICIPQARSFCNARELLSNNAKVQLMKFEMLFFVHNIQVNNIQKRKNINNTIINKEYECSIQLLTHSHKYKLKREILISIIKSPANLIKWIINRVSIISMNTINSIRIYQLKCFFLQQMNFYVYQLIHLVGWLRFDPHNPKGNWHGCLTIVASQVDINVRTAQTFHLSAKDKRMKEVRGLRDSV